MPLVSTRESSHTKQSGLRGTPPPAADTSTYTGGAEGNLLQTLAQVLLLFTHQPKTRGLGTPKYLSTLSPLIPLQGFAEVLAVLPPFPITLPAAKDGTLM